MTPELAGIRETVESVLRDTVFRCMTGDRAERVSDEERAALLKQQDQRLRAAMVMLDECLIQASAAGANSVHRALHKMPGVDPEMLDESVEYAPREEGEG